jgi:hypothetical protein
MKKVRNLSLTMAFVSSLALFSCKDKPANETTDEAEAVETPVDNTQTAEPTGPPVADTVPGVESGVGDEQIP